MKYYKMKLKMSKDKAYVELNWKKRKGLYSWGGGHLGAMSLPDFLG